jgi:hypothetical protein
VATPVARLAVRPDAGPCRRRRPTAAAKPSSLRGAGRSAATEAGPFGSPPRHVVGSRCAPVANVPGPRERNGKPASDRRCFERCISCATDRSCVARSTGGNVGRVFQTTRTVPVKGSRKAARGAGSNSERETKGKRGTAMMTHLVIASSLAADREGRWKATAGASNPYDARPVSPILCSSGQRDERRRRRWRHR